MGKPKYPLWLYPRTSEIPAPRPFVTLDIESRDWQSLDVLGAYDPSSDRYRAFWRVDYLLRWLERYHKGSDVYAHYGGGFDFWFLLRHITARYQGIELSRSGSAAITAILIPDLDIRFIDSFALMPLSLRELCELLEVPGYVELEHFDTATDLELRMRNEADCRCLAGCIDAWRRFCAELGCSPNVRTVASAAVDSWVRALPSRIPTQYSDRSLVENAYYGGRVEVSYREGEGLRYYDLNAAYGWAMTQPLPCGPGIRVVRNISEELLQADNMIGFVCCKLYLPDLPGRLPVRIKDDSTTIGYHVDYPCGQTVEGVWCTRELWPAIESGIELQEVYGAVYYPARPILRNWALKVWKMREKWGALAKRTLNALYGKLGQRLDGSRIFVHPDKAKRRRAEMVPYLDDPELDVWAWNQAVKSPTKLLPVAAAITALVRWRLTSVLFELAQAGLDVYYCDTDSVIYDGPPLEEVIGPQLVGDGLGQWKREGWIEEFRALTSKWYRADILQRAGEKTVVKLASAGVERLTAHDFKRLIEGGAVDKRRLQPFNTQLQAIRCQKEGVSWPLYDRFSLSMPTPRKDSRKTCEVFWKARLDN